MRQTKTAIVCGLYVEEFIHIRKCVCACGWVLCEELVGETREKK